VSQQSIEILALPLTAAGAITARRFVGYDGAQADTQGQKVTGVARAAAAQAGDVVPVDILGTAVVEAGGAVAIGDGVICDAQGRAIAGAGEIAIAAGGTSVTSTAANGAILTGGELPEYVAGRALQAASQAGDFIEVLLVPR